MATRKIAKSTVGGRGKIAARSGTVRGSQIQAGSGRAPTWGAGVGAFQVPGSRLPSTSTGTPTRTPGRTPTGLRPVVPIVRPPARLPTRPVAPSWGSGVSGALSVPVRPRPRLPRKPLTNR